MDEDSNNKRLLIAAALCFAVLVVWNQVFPTAHRDRPRTAETGGVGTATVSADGIGSEVAGFAPAGIVAATGTIASGATIERFEFRGAAQGIGPAPAIPFELAITNLGGGIERFELPSYKERNRSNDKTEHNIGLSTPVEEASSLYGQMLGIEFVEGSTFRMPERAVYSVVERRDDGVRFRFSTDEGIEVERDYLIKRDSFQIELAVTVRNRSKVTQAHRLEISSGLAVQEAMEEGSRWYNAFVPPPDHLSAICHTEGTVKRESYRALLKNPVIHRQTVRWAGMDRQYFLAAVIPRDGAEAECRLEAKDRLARAGIVLPRIELAPGEEKRHKFTAYLGVKMPELLTRADAELEAAIDYTILGLNLAVVCAGLLWVLHVFHAWFGSWGLAILGLTLVVKLMLFPLNQRSGKSMRGMAALKPEMERIRTKHASDRQRQSEEMLKLYREHNVNPAGGCLPILIQMPIWLALYRSLWVSVDLYQQRFLWLEDLTARDPYWVLPVALIAVMFVQQKMTPTTMDPTQQKIMQYTMPLMFGLMMSALPAGLCFYILVNTLLTIAQQHFINRSIGPIGGSASVQGATA